MRDPEKSERCSDVLSNILRGFDNLRAYCHRAQQELLSSVLSILKHHKHDSYHTFFLLEDLARHPAKLELQKHGGKWVVVERDFLGKIDVQWINQKIMEEVLQQGIVTNHAVRAVLHEFLVDQMNRIVPTINDSKAKQFFEQYRVLSEMHRLLQTTEHTDLPDALDKMSALITANKTILKTMDRSPLLRLGVLAEKQCLLTQLEKLIEALKQHYERYQRSLGNPL